MSSSEAATYGAAGGVLAGMGMFILVLVLALCVLTIIARWRIFTKAGEAGWKSIIPIYSDYVEWRISWKNMMMFWVSLGLIVVGCIIGYATGSFVTTSTGMTASSSMGFGGILGTILMLAGAVIGLVQKFKLFKAFGKGVGWFIGYILVRDIMTLVLGLGSSEYIGPQD